MALDLTDTDIERISSAIQSGMESALQTHDEQQSLVEMQARNTAIEKEKAGSGNAIANALTSLNDKVEKLADASKQMVESTKNTTEFIQNASHTFDKFNEMSVKLTAEQIRGNQAGVEQSYLTMGAFGSFLQNMLSQNASTQKAAEPVQQVVQPVAQNNQPQQQAPVAQQQAPVAPVAPPAWLEKSQNMTSDVVRGSSETTGTGVGRDAIAPQETDTVRKNAEQAEHVSTQYFNTNMFRPTITLLNQWLLKQNEKENDEVAGTGTGGAPGGGGGRIPWWSPLLGLGLGNLLPGGATSGYLGQFLNRAGRYLNNDEVREIETKRMKAEHKKAMKDAKNAIKEAKVEEAKAKELLKETKAEANKAVTDAEKAKAKADVKAAKELRNEAVKNVETAKVNANNVKTNPPKVNGPQNMPTSKVGNLLKGVGRGLMVLPGVMAGIEATGKAVNGDAFGATTAATKGVIDTALNFNGVTATGNMAMSAAMMGLKALGVANQDSPETLGELVQYTADGLNANSGWIFGDEKEKQVEAMAGAHGKDLMAMARIGTAEGTGKQGESNMAISQAFMQSKYFQSMLEPYNKMASADAKEKTSIFFQSDRYEKQMNETQEAVKRQARLFAQQYTVLSRQYGEEAVMRMLSGQGGVEAMQEYVNARYDVSNENFQQNWDAAKDKIGAQIRGELPTAVDTGDNGAQNGETPLAAGAQSETDTSREELNTSSTDVDVDKANGGITEEKMKSACYEGFMSALLDPRVIDANVRNSENMGNILSKVLVG